jgi:hypothetical protein
METTIMVVLASLVGLVLSGAVLICSMTKAMVALKKDVSFNKLVLSKWATYNEELRRNNKDLEYDLKVKDLELERMQNELDKYKNKYEQLAGLTPEDIFGTVAVNNGKVVELSTKREIGFVGSISEIAKPKSKTLGQMLEI